MEEEYEALVAAICHVDAVERLLSDAGVKIDLSEIETLTELHNMLNDLRLEAIGGGRGKRPSWVSDLLANQSS